MTNWSPPLVHIYAWIKSSGAGPKVGFASQLDMLQQYLNRSSQQGWIQFFHCPGRSRYFLHVLLLWSYLILPQPLRRGKFIHSYSFWFYGSSWTKTVSPFFSPSDWEKRLVRIDSRTHRQPHSQTYILRTAPSRHLQRRPITNLKERWMLNVPTRQWQPWKACEQKKQELLLPHIPIAAPRMPHNLSTKLCITITDAEMVPVSWYTLPHWLTQGTTTLMAMMCDDDDHDVMSSNANHGFLGVI